jgi:hypothetical protein
VAVHFSSTEVCDNSVILRSSSTTHAHCGQLANAVSSPRMTTLESSWGVHLGVRNILECDDASYFFPCEDALLPKADRHLYVGCHSLKFSIVLAARLRGCSSLRTVGWSSVARHPFTTVLVKGLLEDGLRVWVSMSSHLQGGYLYSTNSRHLPAARQGVSKASGVKLLYLWKGVPGPRNLEIEVNAYSETPKASPVVDITSSSPPLTIIATISTKTLGLCRMLCK